MSKFWACGGKSGLGCGCECWGRISVVVKTGKKREVFCMKCYKGVKK